jgi:glycosyltransferase involved in cell wall biosynthesis
MNEPLKVSVITVVYNDSKNIENTIKSVIAQVDCNIEYIIIDGGSTDGTLDIIKAYNKEISFWRSKKDNGIYDAQNIGITKSTGDYLLFLNSGDTFYKNDVIKGFTDKLEVHKVDLLYGDFRKVFQEYNSVYISKRNLNSVKKGVAPSHQATLISKKVLKEMKGFDLRYSSAAAFDFFCRFYKSDYTYIKIGKIIVDFLAGGYSSNKSLTYNERFKIIKEHFGSYYAWLFFMRRIFLEQNIKKILQTLKLNSLLENLQKYNNTRRPAN